ncbi:MAG TPA: CBS domain-containing protein [Longimicrobiales bacterium]|nr:CBS domain-containing protein [Longimicrobiales bacterium]
MTVRDILQAKGSSVVTIGAEAAVTEAVALLVRHNIGAVVVMQDDDMRGILSERDILRAINEGADAFTRLHVADIMTANVITGRADADLPAVMQVMSERRIRHLPVVEDDRLAGMVSIGDVITAMRRVTEAENRHLHAYISGTSY